MSCLQIHGDQLVEIFLRSQAADTAPEQLLVEMQDLRNYGIATRPEDESSCSQCDPKAAVAAIYVAVLRAAIVAFSSVACFLLAPVPLCLLFCGHANPPRLNPPVNPYLLHSVTAE